MSSTVYPRRKTGNCCWISSPWKRSGSFRKRAGATRWRPLRSRGSRRLIYDERLRLSWAGGFEAAGTTTKVLAYVVVAVHQHRRSVDKILVEFLNQKNRLGSETNGLRNHSRGCQG